MKIKKTDEIYEIVEKELKGLFGDIGVIRLYNSFADFLVIFGGVLVKIVKITIMPKKSPVKPSKRELELYKNQKDFSKNNHVPVEEWVYDLFDNDKGFKKAVRIVK